MVPPADGFIALIPVKSPGTGKSRLGRSNEADRADLAAAFAVDVVSACLATRSVDRVLVISDDREFAVRLAELGAETCEDRGGGLNAALRQGAVTARVRSPSHQPFALCADLPALRPDDLAAALDFARGVAGPCFVRDADGTGTTLYTAEYDAFDPRFGVGSARAHLECGARPVPGSLTSLRRDVDEAASLADAVALGVGPATAGVLAK